MPSSPLSIRQQTSRVNKTLWGTNKKYINKKSNPKRTEFVFDERKTILPTVVLRGELENASAARNDENSKAESLY